MEQPETRVDKVVEKIHGKKVRDPYRWLEKDSKETRDWIARQNKYFTSNLAGLNSKKVISKRLKELYKMDSFGVIIPRGDTYFFMKRKADEDLFALYIQKGLKGKPKVLVNPNKMGKDKTAVLRRFSPSKDGKLLAYSISKAANDQGDLRVMDVSTGKDLLDKIPEELYPAVHTNIEWNVDGTGFWYSHRDFDAPKKGEEKFHQKIYFHKLRTDFRKDEEIKVKMSKKDVHWLSASADGRYLLVTVHKGAFEGSDNFLYNLREKKSLTVVEGIKSEFYPEIHKGEIFILTNHKAPMWKLMSVRVEDISKGMNSWKTVVPEGKDVINWFTPIQDRLFVSRLENVHSILKIYNLEGKFQSEVKLPGLGSVQWLRCEREGSEAFFALSSFLIPQTTFRYDLIKGELSVFNKANSDIDAKAFSVEQVWYKSKDDTKVPMFLVHKKELKKDGSNPALLHAYGGFGISKTPRFDKTIIPFLEAGGVYALANIRGGGEFGEKWHKAAQKEKRQTAFNDFIAASEHLISKRYTNSNKLGIFGWSNGGLLTSTVITQRPELFRVALIGAPVCDMVRFTKHFGGGHWVEEYGDPKDPNMFKALIKYSPYHNVVDGENYPAILIITADKDDRVHPSHAYKMVARFQAANASNNPVLIRIESNAGHGGAASVSKFIEQEADMWAFVFSQVGLE